MTWVLCFWCLTDQTTDCHAELFSFPLTHFSFCSHSVTVMSVSEQSFQSIHTKLSHVWITDWWIMKWRYIYHIWNTPFLVLKEMIHLLQLWRQRCPCQNDCAGVAQLIIVQNCSTLNTNNTSHSFFPKDVFLWFTDFISCLVSFSLSIQRQSSKCSLFTC